MSTWRKAIGILLSVVVFYSCCLSMFMPAYASDISMETEKSFRVMEVEELREVNSETFLLSDGSYECVVYAEDRYYKNGQGVLEEIDNSIVEQYTDVSGYRFSNAANSFQIMFSDANDPAVMIISPEGELSFAPVLSNSNKTSNRSVEIGTGNCAIIADETSKNKITYSDIYPNVDIIYSLENSGLKEYIVMKDVTAPNSFEFAFTADKYDINATEDGRICFVDEHNNVDFILGNLYAFDKEGTYTEDVYYSIKKSGNTYLISVTISDDFVDDPSRVYPIVIDPSVMITGGVNTYDTFVSSKYPTKNYYLNKYLRTGKDEDYYVRRSFIKFDIPTSISDGTVSSAYLSIKKYSGEIPDVTVNRVKGTWSSDSLTWNSMPSFTTTDSVSLYEYSDDWYRAYVTKIVKGWVYGNYSNYGFVLKDKTETNTAQWTTFYSSDAASPNKPELHITYTSNKAARLVGVTNTGHDHSTCLTTARTSLQSCDLSAVYKHTGAFTAATIQNYLDDGGNGVFISRSHAGLVVNSSGTQVGTYLLLNDDKDNPVIFSSASHMNSLDLSNMTLVMFIACQTGKGGESGRNLPSVAVSKGATTAVGFKEEIICTSANSWTIAFCNYMKNGTSVQAACSALASLSTYIGTGLDTHVVCGNKYTTLS